MSGTRSPTQPGNLCDHYFIEAIDMMDKQGRQLRQNQYLTKATNSILAQCQELDPLLNLEIFVITTLLRQLI